MKLSILNLLIAIILHFFWIGVFAQTIVPCSNPRYAPKCIATLPLKTKSYSGFYEDGYVYSGCYGQINKIDVSDVNNLTSEPLIVDTRMRRVYSMVTSGRYLYVAGRTGVGSAESVTPMIRLKFDDSIYDFSKKLGEFDSISTFEGIHVMEDGEYCPMTYYIGKSLRFVSKSGSGSARLFKKLGDVVNEGEVSFSIKNTLSLNTEISIPILSLYGENKMSLNILQSEADEQRITFTGEGEYSDIPIPSNEWYQIKIHFDSQRMVLYYRPQECGDWIRIYEKINDDDNFVVNELVVGVSNLANDEEVLIDDFYYDKGNLDDVSYVNGALTVADKVTGEIYNVYHYDMKGCGVDVWGNILAVSGFYGVNIYDISNPTVPKLIWFEKGEKVERHRCKMFMANDGHVYMIVCLYTGQYRLYDVTNPQDIRYVSSYSIRQSFADGKNWLCYGLTIDYPYAYFPLAAPRKVLGTDKEHRGVMAVDLSDVLHPVFSFGEIPVDSMEYPKSDTRPTKIVKYQNKLFVNNGSRGLIMLDVTEPMTPLYQSNIAVNTQEVTNDVCASPDGHIFCLDEYARGGLNVIYSVESPWAEEMYYTLNISDAKWATLCLPFNSSIPENMHFFTVNGWKGEDLLFNEVHSINANTPYLVKGLQGTYNLSGVLETTSEPLSSGLLIGTYDELYAPVGSYVLQKINNKIGFYSVTNNNIKIPPYRAYLSLSDINYNSSSQRLLFNIEKANSIPNIEYDGSHGNIISVYSVDGIKKANDSKGISIVVFEDGFRKKVIKE